jgi:glycosyltransferase involved in cell wall biosynthesis
MKVSWAPFRRFDVRTEHILFLSTNWDWGGSEELWSRTALKLATEGLDVIALVHTSLLAQKRVLELQQSGARVLSYPLPVTVWRRARRKLSGKTWSVLDLEELLPWVRPALVVTSDGGALPPIDIAEMFVTKKWPFVSIGQNNCELWWPSDELAARYRKILPAALRCYFVSLANQRVAETHLACKIENAEVIRNPFNVVYDAAPPPWPPIDVNSELRLACVARLEPAAKGQDILLEALAHPSWAGRRWRLTLYGDGPSRTGLARLVERFQLNDRVVFAGHVPTVEEIWASNHVLTMASRFEGLPLAIVEAMLCARPVMATDVGGNSEVIENGVSGILAAAPTIAGVREALEVLWTRREDLRDMGKAAAKAIRQKVPPDPIDVFARKIKCLHR